MFYNKYFKDFNISHTHIHFKCNGGKIDDQIIILIIISNMQNGYTQIHILRINF